MHGVCGASEQGTVSADPSQRQYVVGRRWGREHTTGNVRHHICPLGKIIQGGMSIKRGEPEREGGRGELNVPTVR